MQVRALQAGFFGGARRRVGDVFDVPEGAKATWFAPVGETKAPGKAPAGNQPQALSQRGKGQPQSFNDVHKKDATKADDKKVDDLT
jgi:hypothetical protein